jgi:hypothetical protein
LQKGFRRKLSKSIHFLQVEIGANSPNIKIVILKAKAKVKGAKAKGKAKVEKMWINLNYLSLKMANIKQNQCFPLNIGKIVSSCLPKGPFFTVKKTKNASFDSLFTIMT